MWVCDGGDDMAHMQRMDAIGKLNNQVKKLEEEDGMEIWGNSQEIIVS